MKSLHTYQEEVKARFVEKFATDGSEYKIGYTACQGRTTADMVVEDFLKDATTQAYLLGLKRGLELLPKEKLEVEPKPKKRGRPRKHLPALIITRTYPQNKGFNACRTEIETALTQEITRLQSGDNANAS